MSAHIVAQETFRSSKASMSTHAGTMELPLCSDCGNMTTSPYRQPARPRWAGRPSSPTATSTHRQYRRCQRQLHPPPEAGRGRHTRHRLHPGGHSGRSAAGACGHYRPGATPAAGAEEPL